MKTSENTGGSAPDQRVESIVDRLANLEPESRRLDPDESQRLQWLGEVRDYGESFLATLPEDRAFQTSDSQGSGVLDLPIDEEPRQLEELLSMMSTEVDGPGINPASGGHLGYIPGGGLYPASLGDYLAAVTNRYAGVFFASPGAVRMENMLVRWMCQVIGYPKGAAGTLTSGGSIANLTGIATARQAKGIKARDLHQSVIYLSEQVHHSIYKALIIAGLEEAVVRHVPLDSRFRMEVATLEKQVEEDKKAGLNPFLIIASIGTTDTGAIDPLADLARVAQSNGLWLHIDAAYGGFFALCPEIRDQLTGMEISDSLVIDPHKGMFLPYGSGALLVREGHWLKQAHTYQANYMQDTFEANEEWSPADLSPELSRHFRGLRMWLPMQLFGLKAFRAALSEKIWLTRYFYEVIQTEPGFEVGPEPDLSVAIFRYVPETGDPDQYNQELTKMLQADGRVFLSSTSINGSFYIRLAVLSFRTHKNTIDKCLNMLRENVALLNEKLEVES